jgi:hypothetical protein
MNGHNGKKVIMNLDFLNPESFVIVLAIGCLGGLIVAAHLSVRSKQKGDDGTSEPGDD